jgi:hypothetical protein
MKVSSSESNTLCSPTKEESIPAQVMTRGATYFLAIIINLVMFTANKSDQKPNTSISCRV